MDPARCWPDRFGDVFDKSDDVVVRSLFNFENLRNRKSRSLPNFSSVLFRDLAQLRHRLAGAHFDLHPDLALPRIRPDLAHLWPGITVDHCTKIKATDLREKCFCDRASH